MVRNDETRTYNPGQLVFLQGELRHEFYGVIQGKFAKIHLREMPARVEIASLLSQGDVVEVFDRPNQVFGETEALLDRPQPYSVVALETGSAVSIPVHEDSLQETMCCLPLVGVSTCISMARRLRSGLGSFAAVTAEEEAIDKLLMASARAYQAVLQEVEKIAGVGRNHTLITTAMKHPAWDLSEKFLKTSHPPKKSTSVYNAVIRPPAKAEQELKFPAGTLICKKGSLGDRLFILLEGMVEVLLGPETKVQVARPGSVIGEIAVLLNLASKTPEITRTADVVCATPVRAIVIGLDQVESYFERNSEVLTSLMLALTERTKETLMLEEGTKKRLYEKLMTQLRHFLEGNHQFASQLKDRKTVLAFDRAYNFAAQQTKQIYTAFGQAIDIIHNRVKRA